jgi:photoactive yellow protein
MTTAELLRERIARRAAVIARSGRDERTDSIKSTRASASEPDSFVPAEVLAATGVLSRQEVDALSFGAVQCDDTGRVLLYNRAQAAFANLESSRVEGRNFFTQVAPCSNNVLFHGEFKRGVASNCLNKTFAYVFTYRMKPTPVQIHLYRDPTSRTNWIFIRPL